MSIGSLGGITASGAGASLAQTSGSDVERAKQAATDRERRIASAQQADNAAGIAETDGKDHETNDRDADGRRLWEFGHHKDPAAANSQPGETESASGKDASGQRGTSLDLTG